MSQRESGYERIERDCYETPEWVTRAQTLSANHLSITHGTFGIISTLASQPLNTICSIKRAACQQRVGTMTTRPYPHYHRRNDGIMFSILENPLPTNKEIAKSTGYTPSQVSRIVCSPDFQALYEIMMHDAASNARSKWLARISAGTGQKTT